MDELGRIVLPIELRRVMGIQEKDKLEIYTEGDDHPAQVCAGVRVLRGHGREGGARRAHLRAVRGRSDPRVRG